MLNLDAIALKKAPEFVDGILKSVKIIDYEPVTSSLQANNLGWWFRNPGEDIMPRWGSKLPQGKKEMTISQQQIMDWLHAYAGVLREKRDYLTELDSAIGDADHGANMDRGFQAVLAKIADNPPVDISGIFKTTAMTLISTVGGASGPLYGTFFLQAATKTTGKKELDLTEWTALMEAALSGIVARGKAQLGDKTMVDALTPAVEALKKASAESVDLRPALAQSAAAARQGMEGTIPLVARKGRASYLGERSAGHQDPGATSVYYMLEVAAKNLG